MALRLDASSIEVCVQLHPDAWVDFDTLRARLQDGSRASLIINAIHDLPEQFRFGLQGTDAMPCSQVTADALLGVVNDCATSARTLWIGWKVDRALAIEHAEILDEQLEDALVALAPAYLQVSWGSDDDPAEILKKIDEMKAEQARLVADRKAALDLAKAENDQKRKEVTEKSRERTRERVDYETPRSRPSLANLFKSDAPAADKAAPSSAPEQSQDRQEKKPKPERAKTEPRQARHAAPRGKSPNHHDDRRRDFALDREDRDTDRPEPSAHESVPPKVVQAQQSDSRERAVSYVETTDPVDKGSRVKVLRGAFAGKVGVIGELDGKGAARVLLGLLSTRVPTEDLVSVTESKDRPSLQSSHQKRSPIGRSIK
jgi:hypothetical protein